MLNATAIHPQRERTTLFSAWLVFCVFCHVAGWTLSAAHALNRAGYAIFFLAGLGAAAFWVLRAKPSFDFSARRLKRRFGRALPLGFLILSALAVLGGILHEPNNYDALAYRTPRVLHWLAEERWQWIHAEFGSLNSRGPGIEWITAPLFLFTGTDRVEFLINTICFLFLPGRIFAVLTRLGANPRVAYAWMWIFPTGYNFVLQTGSVANDMFTSLWPIAAVEFALRARETNRISHVWLSVLAAGFMTASKAFNLLLLPAWCIAVFPALRLLRKRPVASLGVAVIALTASMAPSAILNQHYCGDWTGLAAEPVRIDKGPALLQLAVNAVSTALYNFAPPIFPFTGAWNRFVQAAVPSNISAMIRRHFENDAALLSFGEMQIEEAAGIGFGVSVLLLIILVRQMRHQAKVSPNALGNYRIWISLSAVAGAIVLMAKSGLYAPARYLLPLYFLSLAPLLTFRAANEVLNLRWWRTLVMITFALAGLLIILSPARPLWPALTILKKASTAATSSPFVERAFVVYSTYRARSDLFRPLLNRVPPSVKTLGVVTFNNPESPLWRPFGSRRVLHIRKDDLRESIRARGIEYAVVDPGVLERIFKTTASEWLAKNRAEVVARARIPVLARDELVEWLLVRIAD